MSPAEVRNFIKHPCDHPLSLRCIKKPARNFEVSRYRISGGIQISVKQDFNPGTLLEVSTRIQGKTLTFTGRVIWSREKHGKTHRLGLVFDNSEDAFKARMIEQLCHIEHYQRSQRAHGRRLNVHDAANEWIERFSPNFPHIGVSLHIS